MIAGYARVSTPDQNLDGQIQELTDKGACERIWSEAASGKRGASRPEWDACLSHLREGDTLVVTELSRLGRNTGDLAKLGDDLAERGIGLKILNLDIDTTTPTGKLIFTIVGAVAEMERELLVERTRRGLEAARKRGKVGGRPRSIKPAVVKRARDLLDKGELSSAEVARVVGISRSHMYALIKADEEKAR